MKSAKLDTVARRRGFTIVELMVTVLITMIVGLALGGVLVHNQIGWNTMYSRTYGDVITDSYVAMKKFDSVIRNASQTGATIDENGEWVEVSYYSDSLTTEADSYARFYTSDEQLMVEYGQLDPREAISTETICGNVSFCEFKISGGSAYMILTLDDGTNVNTITTTAVAHNE